MRSISFIIPAILTIVTLSNVVLAQTPAPQAIPVPVKPTTPVVAPKATRVVAPVAPGKKVRVKSPAPPSSKTRKPTGRATRRVSSVTVVSLSGAAVTLQLDEGGAPIVGILDQKTKYHRVPAHAAKPAPVPGEKLVVRLAYYPDGHTVIEDLWDSDVYTAEQRFRKETVVGVVETPLPPGASQGFLGVRESATGDHITYRVTEKTLFYKAGIPVPPSVFVTGTAVAVKPRALPSGGFMAGVVADSTGTLDQGYRDGLTLWPGTVESVNVANDTLVMKRTDGAVRTILVPKAPPITDDKARRKVGPKPIYTLAELPGHAVIVRVVRGERPDTAGIRRASEVTVTDGGGSRTAPPPVIVNPTGTAPATPVTPTVPPAPQPTKP